MRKNEASDRDDSDCDRAAREDEEGKKQRNLLREMALSREISPQIPHRPLNDLLSASTSTFPLFCPDCLAPKAEDNEHKALPEQTTVQHGNIACSTTNAASLCHKPLIPTHRKNDRQVRKPSVRSLRRSPFFKPPRKLSFSRKLKRFKQHV
jgi:hypothetical protein